MTFSDLLARIQTVRLQETRACTGDYFEAVIAAADLGPIQEVLAAYFGPVFKPAGTSPSGEANRYAKPYGGIRKDQIMYLRKSEGHVDCALLWPWGSGASFTVKIACSSSSHSDSNFVRFLSGVFTRKSP